MLVLVFTLFVFALAYEGGVDDPFDVIVAGAGIGGLTAAATLAAVGGLRVGVIERKWKVGGATASFTRNIDVQMDGGEIVSVPAHVPVGMHTLLNIPEAMDIFTMITGIPFGKYIVDGPFEAVFENAELKTAFQHNSNPEIAFGMYAYALIMAYPQYAPMIGQYVYDLGAFFGGDPTHVGVLIDDYLTNLLGDDPAADALKFAITLHADEAGASQETITFEVLADIQGAYLLFGTAEYTGGDVHILAALRGVIEYFGGKVILHSEIQQFVVKNHAGHKKVQSVFAKRDISGRYEEAEYVYEHYYADQFISNLGIGQTFKPGMFKQNIAAEYGFDEIYESSEYASSLSIVWLLFNDSDANLGFPDNIDHVYNPAYLGDEGEYFNGPRPTVDDEFRVYSYYFNSAHHTDLIQGRRMSYVTSFVQSSWHWFSEWEDSKSAGMGGVRPPEYTAWKEDVLVAKIKEKFYALWPQAQASEVMTISATPLTIRDFLAHDQGAFCGTLPQNKIENRNLELDGLWFVGKDNIGCGIQYSAISGFCAGMEMLGVPGFVCPLPL